MLALLFSLAVGFAPAPGGAQNASPARDPVEQLANWVKRFQRDTDLPGEEELAKLEKLVADVRMTQVIDAQLRSSALIALLDLASFVPRPVESHGRFRAPAENTRVRASQLGFDALEHALDLDGGSAGQWMATEVLASATQPMPRRRAALEALRGRRDPRVLIAVMSCARDPSREVRDAAMTTLEGWDDDGLHRFMLRQLEQNRAQVGWVSSLSVYRHFSRVKLDPDGVVGGVVRDWAQRETSSDDWRRAITGIRVLATLDDRLAVPVLIESLSLWLDRRTLDDQARRKEVVGGPERNTPGHGSRRVEGDLERCLKARSGRNLGLHPDNWARWWRSVQGGTNHEQDVNAITRSNFFGLRLWTDRVVLVLDRSASMNRRFHELSSATDTSRYTEVLRQMTEMLKDLGPQTRFRILLFSDESYGWPKGMTPSALMPATDENRQTAFEWAAYEKPDGGTNLRPAIEQVFHLDSKGEPDLKRIEEDTVVVLCDGETSDGPNWVRQVLERANSQANLIFHCVQIGSAGDGTLQRLAEMTGGEFLQVDG